jgi:hypothetical protein
LATAELTVSDRRSTILVAVEPFDDTDRDAIRAIAEAEAVEGTDEKDAGGRWLAAADAGERSPFLHAAADWRSQPNTLPQRRLLRSLGLNPARYPTKGEASDAIDKKRRKGRLR